MNASRRLAASPARRDAGADRREAVPLEMHAELETRGRADPIGVLTAQDEGRLEELVPIRHGRMMATPFTFYRGAAAVMAADLAATPTTDLEVQLCGDAHLSNFGMFRGADRSLVFDINDFDETLPGPFEWDVKRLAASIVVAGRGNGIGSSGCRKAAIASVEAYRSVIAAAASRAPLDLHYQRLDVDEIRARALPDLKKKDAGRADKAVRKARAKNSLRALRKLTDIVDGRRVIVPDPPLVTPVGPAPGSAEILAVSAFFDRYVETLPDHRRRVLDRYEPVDIAHKIVGVGSVGTRCFIVLLESGDGAPLFLQFKEAVPSVLEAHLAPSEYALHGERVVKGQRILQATGDIFLGWARYEGTAGNEHDFYFRQLWDGKGSVDVESMGSKRLERYAHLCGSALALGHGRTGDPAMIQGYLGDDDTFARAITTFAERYADLTDDDHAAHLAAIESGRVVATPDI